MAHLGGGDSSAIGPLVLKLQGFLISDEAGEGGRGVDVLLQTPPLRV